MMAATRRRSGTRRRFLPAGARRRRSFLDHLRGSALAMAFITTWRMKPRQDLFAPLLPPSALCFDTARNKLFGDIFTRFKVLEKKDKEEAR